jgi:hypothetical protein
MLTENKHHDSALVDAIHYGFCPFSPRHNVSWCDPAANSGSLQLAANDVRFALIVLRVADENVKKVSREGDLVIADSSIFIAGGFLVRSKPPADVAVTDDPTSTHRCH